ncbi:esterase-like activity of phytase family protein [Streptomyces sp. NPDC005423]|uniref:esterase-like activity of phytase family protein n=1 Tax=Streptomyces sp. NPDC005423 TaxID=3155343 RepID=UPI0033BF2D49
MRPHHAQPRAAARVACDNTEGMTWGPTLRDGERTLVLVSDDNFADDAVTQFVALGIR